MNNTRELVAALCWYCGAGAVFGAVFWIAFIVTDAVFNAPRHESELAASVLVLIGGSMLAAVGVLISNKE